MIVQAFDYKQWADERTLDSIGRINRTVFSEPYAFVLQQINHMIIVEELFRSRLENMPPPHKATNSEIIPEFDKLKHRLVVSGKWYFNYVSDLDIEKKQRVISFKFADGNYGSMSVKEIIFHIINHGSYHRGSIAHALDLAEVAHPADGYGIYIHEAEPSRREKT